ncbi:hypothetical protein [Salinispora pacifica]|uniref:hypothetical protein n=1 Tax=Salinispora pacifica TaxID=351187 RepID=UPI0003698FE2|nr:hypothetical protein [Salinispora pacifica]
MSVDVSELFRDFFSRVFGDREVAENFVADPEGVLAAEGIADADLSGVNVAQVAAVVAQESALPPETKDAVAQLAAGGGGGGEQNSGDGGPATDGGQPPLEQIVQTVTELVTVVHQDIDQSTSFFDQSTTIDNSVDVDVDGANASVVTTGDGSQVIGGDNDGQANTGDGAVLAGDDVGNVNTGENSGVVGDGDNTFGDGNIDFGGGNDLANLNFGSGVQDQSSNSIDNSINNSDLSQNSSIDNSNNEQSIENNITTDIDNSVNDSNNEDSNNSIDAEFNEDSNNSIDADLNNVANSFDTELDTAPVPAFAPQDALALNADDNTDEPAAL